MLWRIAAVGLLAALGAFAAFGTVVPQPPAVPEMRDLVEPLALRVQPSQAPAAYMREEQFRRGDTLSAFFARLGIEESDAARLARVRALRLLKPGVHVSAEVSAAGAPNAISFLVDRDTLVQIELAGEGFRVGEQTAPVETRQVLKAGTVRSSLFAAADAAGIPDAIAMQLSDVFAGDIDFHRDLRQGDRFAVVYEQHALHGRPLRAGRLLAAEFTNQGRTFRAVHYGSSYYAADGKNLRKAFLRSPLEFSRVTSGFGMRRHPIARQWLAHRGIDYGAAPGTRVRSVGDGMVDFAGVKGSYGKVVIVRHHGQYSTLYAHLSRFASGVQRGTRVSQNDTIGFVGQTGWATGPHLHYEFRVAGEARNPFSVAMPSGHPVPQAQLPAFRAHAEVLAARLDLLGASTLAMIE